MNKSYATRSAAGFILLLLAIESSVSAKGPTTLVPHPSIESVGGAATKQLGDFGETFVADGFRARGFEIVDGNLGGKGIDLLAWKRGTNGSLKDLRVVEVKTRQVVPEFRLAETKDGVQLSDRWLAARLERIASEHANPSARRVASKALEELQRGSTIVKRELHGIAVGPDRYIIQEVNEAGQVVGVQADARLTSLLRDLSTRGTTAETRATAAAHLAEFDRMKVAVAKLPPESEPLAVATLEALNRLNAQLGRATTEELIAPAAMITEGPIETRKIISKIAGSPAFGAGAITFIVDESVTSWQYYKGAIGRSEFKSQSAQNGVKAGAVGLAVQTVYLLSATPHGLVVVGVAIIVYVVTDTALKTYEEAFTPKVVSARELDGIVPHNCVDWALIDDVATGRASAQLLRVQR